MQSCAAFPPAAVLPVGLCLALHWTELSCSEQLREGGFREC